MKGLFLTAAVLVAAVAGSTAGGAKPVLGATCSPTQGPGIPPPANVPLGIPGFHAAWYGQSGYQSLCPGQTATAVVAFYNSGSLGWVSGRMGEMAYLGTWGPEPGQDRASPLGGDGQLGSPATGWPRYNRVAAQPAPYVGPGQVAWFQFTMLAPQTPGTYRLALRPLVEGATWMEDYGVFWVFTVLPADGGGGGGGSPTPTPMITPTPTPMITPTPTPMITPTPTPTASTPPVGGNGFVGDSGIEGTPDPLTQGTVEATRFFATASGPVTSLSIFLDASNQATSVALGLYSDSNGVPTALLAQGSLSGRQNNAWNTVPIPSVSITSGTPYWIARLSTSGGSLVTRVNTAVPNPDRVDTRSLSSLPSTFSPGGSYPHITSIFAGNAAASTPGPTPTSTPTAAPTPTPAPGTFMCTQVMGYSQTGNWYSDAVTPAFESRVVDSRYQLRNFSGGAVALWADPNYGGWGAPPYSPCASGSSAPDRVIFDVTESFWINEPCGTHEFDNCSNPDTSVARVAQDIRNVIALIRSKYPSVQQIYVQAILGGPGNTVCSLPDPGAGGAPRRIRGTYNHPFIKQAIDQAVDGNAIAAPEFFVDSCNDFNTDTQFVGHLNDAAKRAVGQRIGDYYAARP
jgi:hypothetical protein